MKFYLILKDSGGWVISPFAQLDKPGEAGEVLQPALPLSVVERLAYEVQRLTTTVVHSRENVKKRLVKVWKRETSTSPSELKWLELRAINARQECPQEFEQTVQGRQLTDGDLGWLAQEMHVSQELVWQWVDTLVRYGKGEWLPAVRKIKGQWQCQRCGGDDIEEWPSVFGMAATCKNCSSLGPATSLGALFRSHSLVHESSIIRSSVVDSYSFRPSYALTPAQEQAATELLQFVAEPLSREALIWAACGAGKTEVGFPVIDWALRQGLTVLFAAPRQDVVMDVAPRLMRDFVGLSVPTLTGRTSGILRGSLSAGLVLATTHQVLRFYRAFDLIILDEMDAFPYAGSKTLSWGLGQALRDGGKLISMTATPTEQQLKGTEKHKGKVIRLPARHHRNPLPVPVWEQLDLAEPERLSQIRASVKFWAALKILRGQGPVLLFIPKVAWVNLWVERLRQGMPQATVLGSFSSDPERQIKVDKLRAGQVDYFVSTSILERGVTIEGVQVVVLAADHPLFDERSLVQMAGRAGRSPRQPTGKVLFWSKRKTAEIEKAIRWIHAQNVLAKSQGLIDSEEE